MSAAALARRAVAAAARGDRPTALAHLERARAETSAWARRERQLVEVAEALVAGEAERAAGLAAEHRSRFPADAELLEGLLGAGDGSAW